MSTVLTAFLIGLCLYLVYLALRKPHPSLKGPNTPLLGAIPALVKNGHRYYDFVHECTLKYGRTWVLAGLGGGIKSIYISDAKNVEYILKTNFDNYEKGEQFRELFHELVGQGIFGVDGKLWRKGRKVSAGLFSMKSLMTGVSDACVRHGHALVAVLQAKCKSGQQFDLQDIFFRYTLDSFMEFGFGVSSDSLHDQSELGFHVDRVQQLIMYRFIDPLWKLNRLLGWKRERELGESVRVLHTWAMKTVQDRRQDLQKQQGRGDGSGDAPIERTDLLSTLIAAKDEEGQPFDDVYIRDMIMNYMVAGRDTTATLLSWLFYELMKNPPIMQKVVEEIQRVLDNTTPDFHSTKGLRYLDAVIFEALRLHPPAAGDGKTGIKEDRLPDGTWIPAGCHIQYEPYTIQRLADSWPQPLVFDPQRWISDDETAQIGGNVDVINTTANSGASTKTIRGAVGPTPTPFEFPAFNAGARICIGRNVALLEAKLVTCMILQNFVPVLQRLDQPHYNLMFALVMQGGLPVTLSSVA